MVFPAAARAPPATKPFNPPCPPPSLPSGLPARPRDCERPLNLSMILRERARTPERPVAKLSGDPARLSPPRPLDLERGPLARRFAAKPPTTASARWRLLFSSGLRSRNLSIPPAPMAAVAMRFPRSPVHGPGSLRERKASTAPAMTAACAACAH